MARHRGRPGLYTLVAQRPATAVAGVALIVTASALAVVQPWALSHLVTAVGQGVAPDGPLLLLVSVTVAEALLRGLQTYLTHRTSEAAAHGLRTTLTQRVLSLPLPVFERHRRGALTTLLSSDTNQVRQVLSSGLPDIVSATLMATVASIMMLIIDPTLLAITLAVLLGAIIGIVPVATSIRRTNARYQAGLGALATQFDACLAVLRLLRAYGDEERQQARLEVLAQDVRRQGRRLARLSAVVEPVTAIATQGALLVVLAVGGARAASGTLEVGQLVAFLLYLVMIIIPLSQFMNALTAVQAGLASLDRLDAVMVEEDEDRHAAPRAAVEADPVVPARAVAPDALDTLDTADEPEPMFRLRGVSYEHAPGVGVHDIRLTIPSGRTTAIVGRSGAGKSTLLAVLQRLVEPQGGTIRFRGRPLESHSLAEVRATMHVVEQNAPTYAGTVRDNLLIGAPRATDAQMLDALATVRLRHLVDRDDALDLQVGDGGLALSGGERQRLAWARMLLSDREIFILDEPTSNVDALSERALNDVLRAHSCRRTVVVVAHRMSTIRDADQIIVLDEGRIVDVGAHAELTGRCAIYNLMTREQVAA